MEIDRRVEEVQEEVEMEEVRVEVRYSSMSQEKTSSCLGICRRAVEKLGREELRLFKEVSLAVKHDLDSKLGPSWHVVSGEDFSSWIEYESECCMMVSFGPLSLLFWKHG